MLPAPVASTWEVPEVATYRDMWVFCERAGDRLNDVSLEMVSEARRLMDTYNDDYDSDEQVVAVIVGHDVEDLGDVAIAHGADVALVVDDPQLEGFLLEPYTHAVSDLARDTSGWKSYDEPRYFLFPATNNGRDLSATVCAELETGLASDCNLLYIENAPIKHPIKSGSDEKEFERVLHMKRPDFSGFEWSTILCLDNPEKDYHPQSCSIIPGSFDVADPDAERSGDVHVVQPDLPKRAFRVQVTERKPLDDGVDLTTEDTVVALGRGIGDDPTEGFKVGLDLARVLEAGLGLSRGVVTASYSVDGSVEQFLDEERQIGETGQIVEPDLYIAAGISGAIQHKVGMDDSKFIVSINTDPEAPIMDFSDVFVHGDLFEIIPRLTQLLEKGGGK